MKRLLTFILLSLTAAVCATAQDFDEFVGTNVRRLASNQHTYDPYDTTITAPPAGYKAFYISHVGRHGSRYHASESYFSTIKTLEKCDSLGLLTADGKYFLEAAKQFRDAQKGHIGELTVKGGHEHMAIAGRMARRYSSVFTNPQRRKVITHSTASGRVLKSREYFLTQLRRCYPELEITKYDLGNHPWTKYETSCYPFTAELRKKVADDGMSAFRDSLLSVTEVPKFVAKTFTKTDLPELGMPASRFMLKLFVMVSIRQCLDDDTLPYLDEYFPFDELLEVIRIDNMDDFNYFCISEENLGIKSRLMGVAILESMVKDADSAIVGSDIAAHLRFSHDTYIEPLISAIGGSRHDYRGSYRNANAYWTAGASVCMATNVQMIFFRGRKGDVLVKVLHNEREITFPSLKAKKKVYYSWPELRDYLLARCEHTWED